MINIMMDINIINEVIKLRSILMMKIFHQFNDKNNFNVKIIIKFN